MIYIYYLNGYTNERTDGRTVRQADRPTSDLSPQLVMSIKKKYTL